MPSPIILCAGLFLAPATWAQDAATTEETVAEKLRNSEEKNFISLSIENDSIGGGTDQFYTSGVRLTWFNVNTPVPDVIDAVRQRVRHPNYDQFKTN